MSLNIHTARKDHECALCGKKIPKGHRYWRDFIVGDIEPEKDEKQHTNCEDYKRKPNSGEGE